MAEGQRGAAVSKLNNVLMQMRKNCNHPDLITSAFDPSPTYPSAAELVQQCGKMQLLDRLLRQLKARGHKVLIFSQVRTERARSPPSALLMSCLWCCRTYGTLSW